MSWQTLDIKWSQMPGYLKGEVAIWQVKKAFFRSSVLGKFVKVLTVRLS